jgi:hypothetical protein
MEKPLDLFSDTVDLSVDDGVDDVAGLEYGLSRRSRCRLCVGEDSDELEDDRLLLPWPQVARFSDLSAISSSCRGLMSVWVSRCVFRFDLWLKHL